MATGKLCQSRVGLINDYVKVECVARKCRIKFSFRGLVSCVGRAAGDQYSVGEGGELTVRSRADLLRKVDNYR